MSLYAREQCRRRYIWWCLGDDAKLHHLWSKVYNFWMKMQMDYRCFIHIYKKTSSQQPSQYYEKYYQNGKQECLKTIFLEPSFLISIVKFTNYKRVDFIIVPLNIIGLCRLQHQQSSFNTSRSLSILLQHYKMWNKCGYLQSFSLNII